MFDWHNIFFRGHSKLAPNNGRAQSNTLLGILMRSWAANEVNQYEIPNATTSSIFRQRSLWCHRGRRFVSRYQEAGWMQRERERERRVCVRVQGSTARVDHHSSVPFTRARCIGRFKSSFPWNWGLKIQPSYPRDDFPLEMSIIPIKMTNQCERGEQRSLYQRNERIVTTVSRM